MQKHFLFLGLLPLAAAALTGVGRSAAPAAPAAAPIQLHLSVEAPAVQPDGKTAWLPLTGAARPGEDLRYTVQVQNKGTAPVQNLVVTQPVPAGTMYRAETASGSVTFSLDGKAFAARPTVSETRTDGTVTVRPAAPDTYKVLRWRLASVPAASAQAVAFEVKVR